MRLRRHRCGRSSRYRFPIRLCTIRLALCFHLPAFTFPLALGLLTLLYRFLVFMQCPNRLERVKETYVLKQVREEPKPRREGEECDNKEDAAEDGHSEEDTQQAQHTHT